MKHAPPCLTKLALMMLRRTLRTKGGTWLSSSNRTNAPFRIPPPSNLSKSGLPVENEFAEWGVEAMIFDETTCPLKGSGGIWVNLALSREKRTLGEETLNPRSLWISRVRNVLPSDSDALKVTIPSTR